MYSGFIPGTFSHPVSAQIGVHADYKIHENIRKVQE